MSKWLSRTYHLIVGIIATVTVLLVYKYVTDVIWQGVVMGLALAWVGQDAFLKVKKPEQK